MTTILSMNKLFAFILASTILLTSCSVDWDDVKDKKITELERQVAELKNATSTGMILFEKQTRCGALTPEIQTRVDSINKEYASLGKFSLGGVFYSPIKDACLWIRLTSMYAPDGSPMERRALYQFGDDFGATEPLVGCEKILDDKRGSDSCVIWSTELKKLK